MRREDARRDRDRSCGLAARAIQPPFDRAIVGGRDAPGRQQVQKTIDSLVHQSKDLVAAANAVGITRLTLVAPKK